MRLRLTVVATLVTALAVTIAGWLLIRSAEDAQLAELQRRAEESVDLAASRLDSGARWEEALTSLPSLVLVTADDGTCVASPAGGGEMLFRCSGAVPIPAPADGAVTGGTVDVVGEIDGEPSGSVTIESIRSDFEPVTRQVDTEVFGTLTVSSTAPTSTVVRGLESVGWIVWLVFPVLVATVAVMTWWMAGRVLRPVEAIRAEAASIGGRNIDQRVPEPGHDDEIGRLARTMNEMLDRLDRANRRQHRFVSDASHELRSPVAAIRTDLEVALRDPESVDWSATARAVLAEEARLDALISDLLLLANDDEVVSSREPVDGEVDLQLLVAEEAARRRRLPVTFDPSDAGPDPVVAGDEDRLRRAVANLLDNACRHAERRVVADLAVLDDRVRLRIDDDGPGIKSADRERIFERFTRLDEGRARDRGGAGLGLAVVRSVVDRFGGAVDVVDSPLGGARFEVWLPLRR